MEKAAHLPLPVERARDGIRSPGTSPWVRRGREDNPAPGGIRGT